MSHHHRNSSASARPHQSSPLTGDGVGTPGAETVNELLSTPAQGRPADPKAQPVWITSKSPIRPPRGPRNPRRPKTAPHMSLPPSFETRIGTHELMPSISQFSDSSTYASHIERSIDALPLPPSLPPETFLTYTPIRNTGFLNRIPKPFHIDEDLASTSSSILSRRPSVPTLHSYMHLSTATSRDQSDQLSGSPPMRSRLSSKSMSAGMPIAEGRSRAKSSAAFSDAVVARHRDHSLDLSTEDRATIITPLSMTRMRSTSEMSASPPVTASTLNDESTSSLTACESPQEVETRTEEDPGVGKEQLLEAKNMTTAKVPTNTDEGTLAHPKPSHFSMLSSLAPPHLVIPWSPSKHNVRSDKKAIGARDERTHKELTGGKLIPRTGAGGAVRRVWRSIIGRG